MDILHVVGSPSSPARLSLETSRILKNAGFNVTMVDDNTVTNAMGNSYDLIFISDCVNLSVIGNKFVNHGKPVVLCKLGLYDRHKLCTSSNRGTVQIMSGSALQIIEDVNHPIVKGVDKYYNENNWCALNTIQFDPVDYHWMKPASSGVPILSMNFGSNPSPGLPAGKVYTSVAFEANTQLVDGTNNNARRITLPIANSNSAYSSGIYNANISTPLAHYIVNACLWAAGLSPTSERPHFIVEGSKLYQPGGGTFYMKGVNVNGYNWVWNRSTVSDFARIYTNWRFNTLRVCCYLNDSGSMTHYDNNNNLDQIVSTFTPYNAIVMFEAHDKTGSYWEGADLELLKSWWRDLAIKYKNNPYVWFNIANEPGGSTSLSNTSKWLTMHRECIKTIRDEAGAKNPIVVDAHFWGQDVGQWNSNNVPQANSSILSLGNQVKTFNSKTYENIIFSIHMYDQWNYGDAKVSDYFNRVESAGHCLIIGEYGSDNGSTATMTATNSLFSVEPEKHKIVWAWAGGDSNDLCAASPGGGFQINHVFNPTNLTTLGQKVWDDNR